MSGEKGARADSVAGVDYDYARLWACSSPCSCDQMQDYLVESSLDFVADDGGELIVAAEGGADGVGVA